MAKVVKATAAEVSWQTAGTWEPSGVPSETEDVTFAPGFTGKLKLTENSTCNSFDDSAITGTGGKLLQQTFALIVKGKNAEGYSFRCTKLTREGAEAEVRIRGTGATGEPGLCDFGTLTSEWDNVVFGTSTEANPHKLASNLVSKFTVKHESNLDIGSHTVKCKNYTTPGTATRKLIGAAGGKIEGTSNSSSFNFAENTNLTLELDPEFELIVTDGHESKESFKGGGLNFKCKIVLKATPEGIGPGITGSNTYTGGISRPVIGATNPKLVFAASSSQFLSTSAIAGGLINLSGEAGNKLEILSSTAGTQFTLEASRKVEQDYVKLKDIQHRFAENEFYWGSHSEIVSNVDGAILASKSAIRTNNHRIKVGTITLPNMADSDYEAINKKLAPNHMDHMMLFDGWAAAFLFKSNREEAIKYRAVPMIGWSITKEVQGTKNDGTLGNISTGVLDTYIAESIASAKIAEAAGVELLVRLCHEFNGNWDSYGAGKETPAKFVEGWRYVVNKFKTAGVTNVKWVWGPNVWHTSHNVNIVAPQEYYPGDEYVDFVGSDGYMNKLSPFVQNPAFLHLQNYHELQELAPSKPTMIIECGVAKDARVTRKVWMKLLWEMVENDMPNCVAINYWSRHDAESTEGDYTFDGSGATGESTDPEALQTFSQHAALVPYSHEGSTKYGIRHVKLSSGLKP